jgi:hypothetical protein
VVILDLLLVQQQIREDEAASLARETDLVDVQLALLMKKRLDLSRSAGHVGMDPARLAELAESLEIDAQKLAGIWKILTGDS